MASTTANNPTATASLPKKSPIYTRTGDLGQTSLYNNERHCKSEDYFTALGTVDELNAQLGIAYEYSKLESNGLLIIIQQLQYELMNIGTALATPKNSLNSTTEQLSRAVFDNNQIPIIEKLIDFYDSKLPKLTHFILPSGGGLAAASFHLARTITRRAERETVELVNRGDVDNIILIWLNRLSDLLFVLARYSAQSAGKKELLWIKGNKPIIDDNNSSSGSGIVDTVVDAVVNTVHNVIEAVTEKVTPTVNPAVPI